MGSCDGINYFYNNENGWSWRLKAFIDSSGKIDFFKWDSDMGYWDNATSVGNTYSNVTYDTAGTVLTISGPGGETYNAHDNFTKTVNNSTPVTCSSSNFNQYFNSFNNTARRLLESTPERANRVYNNRKRFLDHDRNSTYSYYYSPNYYSYYSYYSYYDYSYYSYYYSYYDYSSYYDYYYSGTTQPYECQCISTGFNFFTWLSEFFAWLASLFSSLGGGGTV